jgi:hypothetical protein
VGTGAPIGPGAEVLVDGATGTGTGDLVLTTTFSPAAAATHYEASLTAAGLHRGPANRWRGQTFLMAERDDAAAFVFIQPDPDFASRSTVVIRSLEEE